MIFLIKIDDWIGNIIMQKIAFIASKSKTAQESLIVLEQTYGNTTIEEAELIVALGGDGFMLEALHSTFHLDCPVYGMNRGSVGFLMNEFSPDQLIKRLSQAEEAVIHPLRMQAHCSDGTEFEALAINEVSLIRAGPQAAKLQISVDGRVRLPELVCDGALLSTPAGSTAYNYSAHGPILPIGADILAMTAMAAFRPRRWRGALLPKSARVRFDVLEPGKRPVTASADSKKAYDILSVDIFSAPDQKHRILFDPGHGLEERLIREQFV